MVLLRDNLTSCMDKLNVMIVISYWCLRISYSEVVLPPSVFSCWWSTVWQHILNTINFVIGLYIVFFLILELNLHNVQYQVLIVPLFKLPDIFLNWDSSISWCTFFNWEFLRNSNCCHIHHVKPAYPSHQTKQKHQVAKSIHQNQILNVVPCWRDKKGILNPIRTEPTAYKWPPRDTLMQCLTAWRPVFPININPHVPFAMANKSFSMKHFFMKISSLCLNSPWI